MTSTFGNITICAKITTTCPKISVIWCNVLMACHAFLTSGWRTRIKREGWRTVEMSAQLKGIIASQGLRMETHTGYFFAATLLFLHDKFYFILMLCQESIAYVNNDICCVGQHDVNFSPKEGTTVACSLGKVVDDRQRIVFHPPSKISVRFVDGDIYIL